MKRLLCILVLAGLLGCEGTSGSSFSPDPPLVIGPDERPAEVEIPTDYDPSVSYPLLMVLHGRGVDGLTETAYLQLFDFVDAKQFVLLYPNGTLDDDDVRIWNGAGCCADEDQVDDVGYLSGLIGTTRTLTGGVPGWQSSGSSYVPPARLTIAVNSVEASQAMRKAMKPPLEWPTRYTRLGSML
jgi:poly(3-hydroxybutyrate) depolymerase